MRTTHFTGVRTAALAFTVLGALSFMNAQVGWPAAQKGQKAAVTHLPNRTLQRTNFLTSSTQIAASCAGSGCTAITIALTTPISCPVKQGKTCTLYMHVESQAALTASDSGFFRFLIDGDPPKPGPTDSNGDFFWVSGDPNSDYGVARSYAVVGQVTNGYDNETHYIEMDLGCLDQTGNGCRASLGFTSMSTSVFTP
jgi:hypothetical protein